MTHLLPCAKCGSAPIRNKCKNCNRICRTQKEWNWGQIRTRILEAVIKHQDVHGKGSFPERLRIPTHKYQMIPKKFQGEIFNVKLIETFPEKSL